MESSEKSGRENWLILSHLAESLANISEACRSMGIARHVYYAWSRKWSDGNSEKSGDQGKVRKRHPQAISAELEKEIIALARENPEWGCDRISYYLKLNRKTASSPTVQKILIRNDLGRKSQRMK